MPVTSIDPSTHDLRKHLCDPSQINILRVAPRLKFIDLVNKLSVLLVNLLEYLFKVLLSILARITCRVACFACV